MNAHSLICVILMFTSAFLAAFSQILLKKSADEKHRNIILNYLNVKVICAYLILGVTLFLNVYALTGVDFKYASIINSSSYFFAMILSAVLLKDKISWQCLVGNCCIIFGIAVYASNLF